MVGFAAVAETENAQGLAIPVKATGAGAAAQHAYDGEGRRVQKVMGGVATNYVYDAMGELAAEYAPNPAATGTQYLTVDHLGSTRLVTDGRGTVVSRYDYLPFGEEIYAGVGGRTTAMGYLTAPDPFNPKFTGKERDAETGLDFFEARYMSGSQGRFTGADPESAAAYPSNPQTWNGYAYVRNNPLVYVDPSGEMELSSQWINQQFWQWFNLLFYKMQLQHEQYDRARRLLGPPAVITPGTPQNDLANAQDAARNDPTLAPVPNHGPTFCNIATCQIVGATGAPTDGLVNANGTPNLANVDARTLPNSPQWHEVTPEEAQNLANQGVTVVAAQANPGGHGHIATVRPELLPGTQEYIGQGPLINNIGRYVDIRSADQAFAPNQPVRYYAPADNPQQH